MTYLKDQDFLRGQVPMTKRNIRILAMEYLEIFPGAKCLDIGAGTGSISVEMARAQGQVWAIERNEEALELIKKNFDKQGLKGHIISGLAPDDLESQTFDRAFLGGTGGKIEEIFSYLDNNLSSGGILVANFILISNAAKCLEILKREYQEVEAHLIQSSTMGKHSLFKADNPIYIMKGVKK